MDIEDRIQYLKAEQERLYKDSKTGYHAALLCLVIGLIGMYFDFHSVAVTLFIFSAMTCYIASKVDELKSEMVRAKWEQAFFLEKFIYSSLEQVSRDVKDMRQGRQAIID
jgi:hypothetical protein